MSADFTPEKEDYKILTPFKMQVLTNFPYIEADFDALTNYQLLCKVVEYLNNVITNENEVTEQVTSLYNAYVSLQNYVNHYFDSLDLQSLVDNKLDEMAESGELADMIAEYIKMQGQLVYNSVADMRAADNIQNGSFLKTYGFYSYNDGGGALYKARTVTNEDIIDNITIVALHDNTLVAELIHRSIMYIKQFGAKGDGITDDSSAIQKAINYSNNGGTLQFDNSLYRLYSRVLIDNINNFKIIGARLLSLTGTNEETSATIDIKGNSSNIIIDSCYFEKGVSIIHLLTCNNIKVINSTFKDTRYAIIQENGYVSNNVSVINNQAINLRGDFVECNCEISAPSKNWIISENIYTKDSAPTEYKNENRFIGMTAIQNVTITNNVVEYTAGNSIHCEDTGGKILISNNTLKNSYGRFIDIEHGEKDTIISNNIFVDELETRNSVYFIFMGGTDYTIVNTLINGNKFYGNNTDNPIMIRGATSGKILISNNIFNNFDNIIYKSVDNFYIYNFTFINNIVNANYLIKYPSGDHSTMQRCIFNNNILNCKIELRDDGNASRIPYGISIQNNFIYDDVFIRNINDSLIANNIFETGKSLTIESTYGARVVQSNNLIVGTGLVQ